MNPEVWLEEVQAQYRQYKQMCEDAASQVNDEQFFARVDNCPHSIAILMKHIGGNHRSRWRDFLTSDGEKQDRDRESEFHVESDSRSTIRAHWDEGWRIAFEALAPLKPDHLERTITIRGEPHLVIKAIQRNLTHVAYHAGQVVMLARSLTSSDWKFLSIPPGKSDEYNQRKRDKYGDWWKSDDS